MTITSSSINGNSATNNGGGIWSFSPGTLSITNSTITGNSGSLHGGGIYNFSTSPQLANSIIALNPAGMDCSGGGFTTLGHNLDGDNSCELSTSTADLPGVDPLIGPLQDNGGPTQTHTLLSVSPAIDAGDNTLAPVTDQRGFNRMDTTSDIGAFEFGGLPSDLPIASVLPTDHDFGDTAVGGDSTTQSFTLSNQGTADLVTGTISLAGQDVAQFRIQNDSCSGVTLVPSGSCTLEAVFNPDSPGAKNSELNISSSDPLTPTLTVSLTGRGFADIPNIAVSSTGHDFGVTPVGISSMPLMVNVHNTGGGELMVGSVALTGANTTEFVKTNDTCSNQILTRFDECAVDIIFSPGSEGSKNVDLAIPSNDPDTPVMNLSLSGTGFLIGVGTVVTRTDDTNDGVCDVDCSLREAIATATPGDTIIVPPGAYTLTLGSEITIQKDLILIGAGSESTIIQAADTRENAVSGVFQIFDGIVSISGMTIRHGNSTGNGGAIFNSSTLSITDSVISHSSTPSTGSSGGGISNFGVLILTTSIVSDYLSSFGAGIMNNSGVNVTLTITDSTISDNAAAVSGGGILNSSELAINNSTISDNTSADSAAGIHNQANAAIINSTLSGNSANVNGGGISNTSSGTISIINSTITGNSASLGGGGIRTLGGVIEITYTVIAGNVTGSDCAGAGTVTSLGHNLDGDNTCGLLTSLADLPGVGPLLGPLQENGGLTRTHALLSGSPAIDAGNDGTAPDMDQRHFERVGVSDIGAFEFGALPPGPARIDISLSGFHFGEVLVGGTSLQTFTISNMGDENLIIGGIAKISGTFFLTGPMLPSSACKTISAPDRRCPLQGPARWW